MSTDGVFFALEPSVEPLAKWVCWPRSLSAGGVKFVHNFPWYQTPTPTPLVSTRSPFTPHTPSPTAPLSSSSPLCAPVSP